MTDTDIQLEEALRFTLNWAFAEGRNSPTAIGKQSENVELGKQRIRDLFKQCIPTAEVREMLMEAITAGALSTVHDLSTEDAEDRHWKKVKNAILERHGYKVSE